VLLLISSMALLNLDGVVELLADRTWQNSDSPLFFSGCHTIFLLKILSYAPDVVAHNWKMIIFELNVLAINEQGFVKVKNQIDASIIYFITSRLLLLISVFPSVEKFCAIDNITKITIMNHSFREYFLWIQTLKTWALTR